MIQYLLKRLLLFVPTMVLISLLTFFISVNTPGDPLLVHAQEQEGHLRPGQLAMERYLAQRQSLGLDLPVFYFSFSSLAQPDTLHRIPFDRHRKWLRALTHTTGNWQKVAQFYQQYRALEDIIFTLPSGNRATLTLQEQTGQLYAQRGSLSQIGIQLTNLTASSDALAAAQQKAVAHRLKAVKGAYNALKESVTPWKSYVPAIHWHGWRNQYHRWLFGLEGSGGLLWGDFGRSYRTQQPVTDTIAHAAGTTLQLSILAIVLAYLLAIPLGVFSAARQGSRWDRIIQTALLLLYSLPVYWIGTLLIVFLGGGDFLAWFPPYGLGQVDGLQWWDALLTRLHHLVLPVFCLVYPTLAFLSRQARGGVVSSLHEDYIRTARAKGLPERLVIWRHGFRNALLPIITLLANVFPYALAGSVMVEVIFSIQGMGQLTLDALYTRDYPVVYGIVVISAVLTLTGYWISDALYAWADPRIRWKNRGT